MLGPRGPGGSLTRAASGQMREDSTKPGVPKAVACIRASTDRAFFAPLGTDVVMFATCLDAVLRGELAA